jgi:hypothetical protein
MGFLEAGFTSGTVSSTGIRVQTRLCGVRVVVQARSSVQFNCSPKARRLVVASRSRNCTFLDLKVGRLRDRQEFGRNDRTNSNAIAARLFGGELGPSRPRITTPRRPLQGDEPSCENKIPTNEYVICQFHSSQSWPLAFKRPLCFLCICICLCFFLRVP